MNYLWEVALKADDNNIEREKIRYKPARSYSPYIEASFENLNEEEPGDSAVEVNPLLRFTPVFSRVLDINETRYPHMREWFFDFIMQYMVQIDLREGLSKGEYYLRFIMKDVLAQVYGEQCSSGMKNFTHFELRRLLVCMRMLFSCGTSMSFAFWHNSC